MREPLAACGALQQTTVFNRLVGGREEFCRHNLKTNVNSVLVFALDQSVILSIVENSLDFADHVRELNR